MRPDVSVVIPVKDRAKLLAQTLRSVQSQTRPPGEVIVVDDGSTDPSAAVASDMGATVLTVPRARNGPAAARNEGLARVGTEFVCLLDSDDLLRPQALERLTDALERNPTSPFAFGDALEARREGPDWLAMGIISPLEWELADLPASLYARNFVPASAVVARTEAVIESGGFPAHLPFNEDHYLWIELARRASPVHVAEVLAVSRRHAGSRHDPLAYSSFWIVTGLAERDRRLRARRPDRMGVQLVNMSVSAVRGGRPRELARLARDLFLRQPDRGKILRAALRQLRTRRSKAGDAARLWTADPEIRRFLAIYD